MALADAVSSAVAHWNLNESSGTRVDSVGSNDLTDNNTVGVDTGKFGNAAYFDILNSEYLSINDNAALSMGDVDFMLRAWIKLESTASSGVVIGKWNYSSGQREYAVQFITGTNLIRLLVSSDGSTSTTVDSSNFGSLSTGVWYLVHAWHDSTANQIGISINAGTPNTASHSTGVFNGTSQFRLGSMVAEFFPGFIDDTVVLKNYILDSTERTEDYNSGTGVAFEDWFSGTTLTADAGSFTLTGQTANLLTTRTLTADSGSFALTGQAATLLTGKLVAADSGSFALTGQAATLTVTRLVGADSGSFALTGQAASLERGLIVGADTGSFALTGQAATLIVDRSIAADSGSFAFTGQAATLTVTSDATLVADAGSFDLTGQTADLLAGKRLSADSGVIALTGQAATLTVTSDATLVADAGSFDLTGQEATLKVARILQSDSGSIGMTGQEANLLATRLIAAGLGTFVFSGQDATLNYAASDTLTAESASFALTGQAATLTYTPVSGQILGFRVGSSVLLLRI